MRLRVRAMLAQAELVRVLSGGASLALLATSCDDAGAPTKHQEPATLVPSTPPRVGPVPSASEPQVGPMRFATRVGNTALLDVGEKEAWPRACQIWSACLPLKTLPVCDASLQLVAADDITATRAPGPPGARVAVRGPLGLFGGIVQAPGCDRTKRCCTRRTAHAFLGTAPRGVFLRDMGCVGDESRQCCDLPAFGEELVATGTLLAIPGELRIAGIAWELEQVELCRFRGGSPNGSPGARAKDGKP
jgi:hypothetical protein